MVMLRNSLCAGVWACCVLLLSSHGCAGASDGRATMSGGARVQSDLAVLTDWMTGSFSSAAQAEADPENYYDIRLQMVPIWTGRDDGPWLYVEQAAAGALERPYRQRVYHLIPHPDGTIESAVYVLPGDPLVYAGAWREPARFDEIGPSDLELRSGCSLYLARRADGSFAGSTRGTDCASNLRGATYATSEAVIKADSLVSWDRGFDASGAQVWGATAGGYVFQKVPE